MAPKKAEVIDNPPMGSSSEVEESGSSEEESESSAQDSKKDESKLESVSEGESDSASDSDSKPVEMNNQPIVTLRESSTFKSKHESDSEGESYSGSDSEPPKKKNKQSVVTSGSAVALPESARAKRPLEQAESAANKNLATEHVKNPKQDAEVKNISGDETKKMMFQRVFSEKDEIALLQSVLDFNSTNRDPYDNIDAFCNHVKKLIHLDATKIEIVTQLPKLRRNFNNTVKKALKQGKSEDEIVFTRDVDQKVFELSRKIWGEDGILASKSKNKLGESDPASDFDSEPAKKNKQPVVTLPESSMVKSKLEPYSEGESGSSSDSEPPKKKNKQSIVTSGSAATLPESSTAKRPLEQAESEENKKLKISATEHVKNPKQDAEVKKISGDEAKQMMFQRLFSETDVITLLQSVLDFNSTGRDPYDDIDAFCIHVNKLIDFDATRNQIVTKLRRLRIKFTNTVKTLKQGKSEVEKVFTRDLAQKVFELSRKIWGEDGILASKSRKKLGETPKDKNLIGTPKETKLGEIPKEKKLGETPQEKQLGGTSKEKILGGTSKEMKLKPHSTPNKQQEETEIPAAKSAKKSKQPVVTLPESSTVKSKLESDSEGESDSDSEPSKKKNKQSVVTSGSAVTLPESSTAKRPLEQAKSEANKKLKTSATEHEKNPKPYAEVKMISGDEANNMFQWLFSQKDEIALLQSVLDFNSTGRDPYEDIDAFCTHVKKLIDFDATKNQIVTKLTILRKKCNDRVKKAVKKGESEDAIVFTNDLDQKVFELSRKIWGEDCFFASKSRKELEETQKDKNLIGIPKETKIGETPKEKKLGETLKEKKLGETLKEKKLETQKDKNLIGIPKETKIGETPKEKKLGETLKEKKLEGTPKEKQPVETEKPTAKAVSTSLSIGREIASFFNKENSSVGALDETTLAVVWEKVADGKEKREVEEQWKKLEAEQAELSLKRTKLVKETAKVIFKAYES